MNGSNVKWLKNQATTMILIDTNILARLLLKDIPDHYMRAMSLFETVQQTDLRLFAPSSVFVELAYLLTSTKGVPRVEAAAMMLEIVKLPGLEVEHSDAVESGIRFWRNQGPLSFVDCYHLALARHLGVTQIYTFDNKMDRYPGVERIEP
jgi:predicted nucleic acid-binding protein